MLRVGRMRCSEGVEYPFARVTKSDSGVFENGYERVKRG